MTRLQWSAMVIFVLAAPLSTSQAPARAEVRDPRAVQLAAAVLEKMGGKAAWDKTRYIRWTFFDRNTHYWDKWTGHHRIEGQDRLVLFNVNTLEGRVWEKGQEITEPAARKQALERAHRTWVNDMYWLLMPYKLLDPGVNLAYIGEQKLPDGRACDVIELTFESVGYTPQNRYHVFIARETGLVEQWSYFPNRDDEEPRFTLPWAGWRRFGDILLATERGNPFGTEVRYDWRIAVYDKLPESVFTSPDRVEF